MELTKIEMAHDIIVFAMATDVLKIRKITERMVKVSKPLLAKTHKMVVSGQIDAKFAISLATGITIK